MKNILVAVVVALSALATTGCAITSGQSTVGQYVDDATVATRVKSRFAEDAGVSAMRIQVEALKGTVQLAGFATSPGREGPRRPARARRARCEGSAQQHHRAAGELIPLAGGDGDARSVEPLVHR